MCITGIRKNTLGEAVQRAASTSVLFLCTSLLYGIIYGCMSQYSIRMILMTGFAAKKIAE